FQNDVISWWGGSGGWGAWGGWEGWGGWGGRILSTVFTSLCLIQYIFLPKKPNRDIPITCQ
ncbi:MAG: hypothetical protein F6K40_18360, partial [Okeania sp. SIO3I5]|uniref:hypothetical protein n=1 Tax=Okeania sp. SIO3I5 TaxID=2607805 RepID=UPI0013BBCF2B